jgi:hypothetical protein
MPNSTLTTARMMILTMRIRMKTRMSDAGNHFFQGRFGRVWLG